MSQTKKQILAALFLISSSILMAQKENMVWKFGNGLGIDFKTCPPTQLYEGASSTWENACAISEPVTGNLLFYTNNYGVFDRNDQMMKNGNIRNSNSVTQTTIVPHPNKDSSFLYYIFSCKSQSNGNQPLVYHVVDMRKNGGAGEVVINNAFLLSGPLNEKVVAIRGTDRKSYRVIVHGFMSDVFYTFKIDESGLNITPIESHIGKVINQPCLSYGANIGSMVASPDGNSIAYLNFCDKDFQLFKFDYNTGILFDYINISNNQNPCNPKNLSSSWGGYYGGSFSPNSQFLYITTMGSSIDSACDLYQYNVSTWSPDIIEASLYTVKRLKDTVINGVRTRSAFKHLKNGPDGKLYIGISYDLSPTGNLNAYDFCLPAILQPNKGGQACEFTNCSIKFNPASVGKSYSNFGKTSVLLESWCLNNLFEMPIEPRTKQRIRGETKIIHCQQSLLKPFIKPTETVMKTIWSDKSLEVQRHRNLETGVLWVDQETECYIYRDSLFLDERKITTGKTKSDCIQSGGNELKFLSDTSELRQFEWNDKDSSKQPNLHVSETGTYLLKITKNCEIITDTFKIREIKRNFGRKMNLCIGNGRTLKPFSITGATIKSIWSNGSSFDSIPVVTPGVYWVDVINKCDTIRDSFVLKARAITKGITKSFCPGVDISALSVVNSAREIVWSNGSNEDTIKHAEIGKYWVETVTECEIIRDSFVVEPIHIHIPNLSKDTSICGRSILYHLSIDTGLYKVLWKNGSFDSEIELKSNQEYPFKITTKIGCTWDTGRIQLRSLPNQPIYFENSFTPNGDGRNEFFPSFNYDAIERIESIEVYSRWGDLIYSATNQRWDGTFYGEPCPDGIYLCKIVYRNCDFTRSYFSSMITLLR